MTDKERRDYFAGQALAGLLAHGTAGTCENDHGCVLFGRNVDVVAAAVDYADTLIAALDSPIEKQAVSEAP